MIEIGKYVLRAVPGGKVEIVVKGDGEAGEFNPAKLEEKIDELYREKF